MKKLGMLAIVVVALSLSGESRKEKDLAAKLADSQEQLRKERAACIKEKNSANETAIKLAREYAKSEAKSVAKITNLAGELSAANADRESLRLQIKNERAIAKFQVKVAAAPNEVDRSALLVKEVPKIEHTLAKQHEITTENQQRNYEETRGVHAEMIDIKALIVDIVDLQKKDHAEIKNRAVMSQKNSSMIQDLRGTVAVQMWVVSITAVIFAVCICFGLYYIAFVHNKIDPEKRPTRSHDLLGRSS